MNIEKYKNMMFLDADAGGGEGGSGSESTGTGGPAASPGGGEISRGAAAFEPAVKQTTGEPALPSKKTTEKAPGSGSSGAGTGMGKGGEGEEIPPTTMPSGFDPKQFADALGDKLKPFLEQKVEEKKMSAEEARKLLKVWEPDDAWYAKYDNLETRKDAVAEMRDALVEQADVLAQARMQKAIQDLRAEFQPHLEAVQQAENLRREERLHTEYPVLKNPALQPLVDAIAQDFHKRGQTFKTEKELFKALATGVEAVLKVNNPDFKLDTAVGDNGGGEQRETNADRGGRSIPVTTPGGGGGTGRREGGQAPAKPRGIAVFDK